MVCSIFHCINLVNNLCQTWLCFCTQCSYHKCSRITSDNRLAVESFADRFTHSNSTFRCYYDPDNPSHALLEVVGLATAVNAIVWPALATVCGLSLFLFQVSFFLFYCMIFHGLENVASMQVANFSTVSVGSLLHWWKLLKKCQFILTASQVINCVIRPNTSWDPNTFFFLDWTKFCCYSPCVYSLWCCMHFVHICSDSF